jgi:hypothetical protein
MQTATHIMRSVAVAVLGLVFFALLYFGGYMAMGTRSISAGAEFQVYRHEWQANVFRPAAKIESEFRQKPVDTAWVID